MMHAFVAAARWPSSASRAQARPRAGGCRHRRLCAAALAVSSALAAFPAAPAASGATTADPVAIPAIQGRGARSPFVGRRVATRGAVTRVDSNGFFLQDPVGDGDPRTSDALFIFTGAAPTVVAGQCVRVEGRVVEFDTVAMRPDAAAAATGAARTVTELHDPSDVQRVEEGCVVAPVVLPWPLPPGDGLARLEGMLVTLRGPFTVQQNYFLGRFGQLTLASGGRVEAPTNRVPPGPAARARAAADARRFLLLDDGSARQDPAQTPFLGEDDTVRAGDTVAEVTGVVDYGLATASRSGSGAWKLQPTLPVRFLRANPRTPAPAPVGGTLKVASANLDNFFATVADGTHPCAPSHTVADCRGARSEREFERQKAKIVAELAAIDADVVGLEEVENDGPTSLQALVDALNERAGAAIYARIDDPPEGSGHDAIKVALIYRPTRVRPVGAATSDLDPVHNRAPLGQTFERVGADGAAARFNVVVSHFKSRRCEGAEGPERDRGDLQGCWNPRRVRQARALRRFAAGLQRRSGVDATLLVGDFNAYAREDPIAVLTADAARRDGDRHAGHDATCAACGMGARFGTSTSPRGDVDEIARFDPSGYTFVFDGAAGRLDQVLASAAMAASVTGVAIWHVNADEPSLLDYSLAFRAPGCAGCAPDRYAPTPYRASDHDPVVIGLRLPG